MVNPRLLEYIKQRLAQFATEEDIRGELLGAGWALPDIAEGFAALRAEPFEPQPSTTSPAPAQPQTTSPLTRFSGTPTTPGTVIGGAVHRPKKWIVWIVVVLVILLVGGGLFFAYTKKIWPLQNGLPSFLKFSFLSHKPTSGVQTTSSQPTSTVGEAAKLTPPPLGPDEFLGMGVPEEVDFQKMLASSTPEEKAQFEKEKADFEKQSGISYQEYLKSLSLGLSCADFKTGKTPLLVEAKNNLVFGGESLDAVVLSPFGELFATMRSGSCGYRSLDGGKTWKVFLENGRWEGKNNKGIVEEAGPFGFHEFIFDPSNKSRFYGKQYLGPILETTDSAIRWKLLRIDGSYRVGQVTIDSRDSNERYAVVTHESRFESPPGSKMYSVMSTTTLYRSSDGGTSWAPASTEPRPCRGLGEVVSAGRVYLSCDYSLYVSDDKGVSWQKVLDRDSAPHAFLSASADVVYGSIPSAGIQRGTFSLDGGKTWNSVKFPSLYFFTIDPTNTKEMFGYSTKLSSKEKDVLQHSVDGGKTWQSLREYTYPDGIHGIAVDYKNKTVFVASDVGLEMLNY